MSYFYQRLRVGDPPIVALQAAQNSLRSLDSTMIKRESGRLQQELKKVRLDEEIVRLLNVYTTTEKPDVRPASIRDDYSHPFYWAPFILVGGSSIVI